MLNKSANGLRKKNLFHREKQVYLTWHFCSAYQNLYSWSWVLCSLPVEPAKKKKKNEKNPKMAHFPQERCNTKGEKMSQELLLEPAVFKELVWILFWAGQIEPRGLRLYTTITFRNKHDLMFAHIKHNMLSHLYKLAVVLVSALTWSSCFWPYWPSIQL